IHTPPPRYPPNAQRRGQQGTVLLRVQVDANGRPEDIDVIDGSGFRSLDRAAAEAVRRWHFEPARRDGRPVRGTVEVPVHPALRPNPTSRASASNPGNEVPTLPTSAMWTVSRASCPATANAIAMRWSPRLSTAPPCRLPPCTTMPSGASSTLV